MPNAPRGLGSVKTLRAVTTARARRTPATALLELSSLAYERELLTRELVRWEKRHREIESRMAEIAAKEAELRAIAGVQAGGVRPARPHADAGLPKGFKASELRY